VTFEKQMMSRDKYLIKFIFAPNGGYCVDYLSNDFAQHAGFENCGNVTRTLPRFGWGIFSLVSRLDQSRASENS